jgi:hypothetical protein
MITLTTDPKTLMFEGLPHVEIVAIGGTPGRLAIYAKKHPDLPNDWAAGTIELPGSRSLSMHDHSSGFYHPDGTQRGYVHETPRTKWPRIVERPAMLDPRRPIDVRLIEPRSVSEAHIKARGYKVIGLSLDTPPLILIKGEQSAVILEVDPTTGRVQHEGGFGSNLQFFNPPQVSQKIHRLDDGTLVVVDYLDGKAVGVDLCTKI